MSRVPAGGGRGVSYIVLPEVGMHVMVKMGWEQVLVLCWLQASDTESVIAECLGYHAIPWHTNVLNTSGSFRAAYRSLAATCATLHLDLHKCT